MDHILYWNAVALEASRRESSYVPKPIFGARRATNARVIPDR
jgi:hypothetical protein